MTDEKEVIPVTVFGLPLDVLQKGGAALILTIVLALFVQMYQAKDSAYILLSQSISTNTTQLGALSAQVVTLQSQVTNLRIQFAAAGINAPPPAISTPDAPN